MFQAMFLTGFYGFLRVGEITSKNVQLTGNIVQYTNLVLLVKRTTLVGAKLTLTNFKHNTAKRQLFSGKTLLSSVQLWFCVNFVLSILFCLIDRQVLALRCLILILLPKP